MSDFQSISTGFVIAEREECVYQTARLRLTLVKFELEASSYPFSLKARNIYVLVTKNSGNISPIKLNFGADAETKGYLLSKRI